MTSLPEPVPDATTVVDLVDRALSHKPTCGRTRVLAIDGPAGSGKTTLAGVVAEETVGRGLPTVVHHLDDVYDGWTGLDDALVVRVTDQVLGPLSRHEPARWQRYDWYAGEFDGWETFDPPLLLVLEGCGSGARDYAAYTTLLVWVEADREERIRRGVERDGEQVLPNWLAWMESEQRHFAEHGTRDRADVRLSTG
jgi:uridine kinase